MSYPSEKIDRQHTTEAKTDLPCLSTRCPFHSKPTSFVLGGTCDQFSSIPTLKLQLQIGFRKLLKTQTGDIVCGNVKIVQIVHIAPKKPKSDPP